MVQSLSTVTIRFSGRHTPKAHPGRGAEKGLQTQKAKHISRDMPAAPDFWTQHHVTLYLNLEFPERASLKKVLLQGR